MYTSNKTYRNLGNSIGAAIGGLVNYHYKTKQKEEDEGVYNQIASLVRGNSPKKESVKPIEVKQTPAVDKQRTNSDPVQSVKPKGIQKADKSKDVELPSIEQLVEIGNKIKTPELKNKAIALINAYKADQQTKRLNESKKTLEEERQYRRNKAQKEAFRKYGDPAKVEDYKTGAKSAVEALRSGNYKDYIDVYSSLPTEYQKVVDKAAASKSGKSNLKTYGTAANQKYMFSINPKTGEIVGKKPNPNYVPPKQKGTIDYKQINKDSKSFTTSMVIKNFTKKKLSDEIKIAQDELAKYQSLLETSDSANKDGIKKAMIKTNSVIETKQAEYNTLDAEINYESALYIDSMTNQPEGLGRVYQRFSSLPEEIKKNNPGITVEDIRRETAKQMYSIALQARKADPSKNIMDTLSPYFSAMFKVPITSYLHPKMKAILEKNIKKAS